MPAAFDRELTHLRIGSASLLAVVCDSGPVDRKGLYAHLALARYLVEAATARFADMTRDEDHPRVETARGYLQAAWVAVTKAAGGISTWPRVWIDLAVAGGAAWAAAAATGQFIGLSGGWTISITIAVVVGLMWPVYALTNAAARRLNRWRTRAPEPLPNIVAKTEVSRAAEVLGLLNVARDSLASAMRDRYPTGGYPADTAAGFDWSRRREPRLFWISLADRRLCQVIYSIEIWLTVLADEQ